MEVRFIILLIVSMATLCSSAQSDVTQFGAKGDGVADDSQAFLKAWAAVCGDASNNPTLVVPKGKTFLLQPATFQGPCKSPNLHFQIDGDIVAPQAPSAWKEKETWLFFTRVTGFLLDGNGKIDGQGAEWWTLCKDPQASDCLRPTMLAFVRCSNFQVNGVNIINSPKNHISVSFCDHGSFSNLHITAPEKSPNTNGIDISSSNDIKVVGGNFATGDDCVAINSRSFIVDIVGLACGPGHGISVGSLGRDGGSVEIEAVHVKNCTLTSTQNGLRIKTWQGGSGYAKNIIFEDNTLVKVGNPIIIDQFYCPDATCNDQASAVKVSDVSYSRILGTTIAEAAIALNCSKTDGGCTNVVLQDINITPADPTKMKVRSVCNNAHGRAVNTNPRVDCLQP